MTVRRKRRRKVDGGTWDELDDLGQIQLETLFKHGEPMLPQEPLPTDDPDTLKTLWNEIKGRLVADYIQTHPGRRPVAWWHYECEMDAPADQSAFLAERGLLMESEALQCQ